MNTYKIIVALIVFVVCSLVFYTKQNDWIFDQYQTSPNKLNAVPGYIPGYGNVQDIMDLRDTTFSHNKGYSQNASTQKPEVINQGSKFHSTSMLSGMHKGTTRLLSDRTNSSIRYSDTRNRSLSSKPASKRRRIPMVKSALDLSNIQPHIPFLDNSLFPRRLNRTMHHEMIRFLERVYIFFKNHDIQWILGYGTLLGSYMSHNILPWDDDLDIVIWHNDLVRLINLERELRDEQDIGLYAYPTCHQSPRQKIHHKNNFTSCQSIKIKLFQGVYKKGVYRVGAWTWPFVDAISYSYNASHAWINNFNTLHIVKRVEFFPLVDRPFDHLMVPSPYNPVAIARSIYKNRFVDGSFKCKSSYWDHVARTSVQQRSVDCVDVAPYYPFVRRKKVGDTVLESLCVGSQCYYYVILKQPYQPDWQPTPYQLNW